MEKILVIEDDLAMRRGLVDNFEFAEYEVIAAGDGEVGLELAVEGGADLIVLDVMLPGVNGYEICRLVRKAKIEVPIVMLTAKGQESDIVLGLNLGADDYVTKPFSIKELLARVESFLRRARREDERKFCFGEFELDVCGRELRRGGDAVELSPKEFELLVYFLRKQGRALTRDDILRAVWGFGCFVTSRSVDRCVTTLRGKIEADGGKGFIKTIRSVGYKFEF